VDTDPLDADSCLAFFSIQEVSEKTEFRIQSTSIDRYYDVEFLWNTNLVDQGYWSDTIKDIQGVGGSVVVTSSIVADRRFFRVHTARP